MNISMTRLAILSLPIAVLSACSSGGAGGASAGLSATASFDEIEAQGDLLVERYEDETWTEAEDMPTSGSATYAGVAAYGAGSVDDLIDGVTESSLASQMSLTADFTRGEVYGAFTDFRSNMEGYGDTVGRITVRNGEIINNALVADVDGQISGNGELAVIEGGMSGLFVGGRAEAVAGGMDMVFTDQSSGVETEVSGLFVGERD